MAGAAFDDRQVPRGELALDADVVAGVLGIRAAHHRCTRATSSSGRGIRVTGRR